MWLRRIAESWLLCWQQLNRAHIADATANKLVADGVKKVGLLGTRFTMEQDFYKSRLVDKFGIDVVVPNTSDQTVVHIIYDELCRGVIRSESREQYLNIVNGLHEQGAEAAILGCTEIALLIQQEHTRVPLYDTTGIHAAQAVQAVQLAISDDMAI
ncbi:Aspartate racemase [Vibrio mangrovi]|uniref:Aspartate racemase n=1 Tax=Vibrio mangrovi TaxID=474394 RepID=A0A1Y6ITU3_9VIBR|nr:Aspartate racemase [Vibrio mangrovi]